MRLMKAGCKTSGGVNINNDRWFTITLGTGNHKYTLELDNKGGVYVR
jgi:hypothetical protein